MWELCYHFNELCTCFTLNSCSGLQLLTLLGYKLGINNPVSMRSKSVSLGPSEIQCWRTESVTVNSLLPPSSWPSSPELQCWWCSHSQHFSSLWISYFIKSIKKQRMLTSPKPVNKTLT
jgi:hypothetical protein